MSKQPGRRQYATSRRRSGGWPIGALKATVRSCHDDLVSPSSYRQGRPAGGLRRPPARQRPDGYREPAQPSTLGDLTGTARAGLMYSQARSRLTLASSSKPWPRCVRRHPDDVRCGTDRSLTRSVTSGRLRQSTRRGVNGMNHPDRRVAQQPAAGPTSRRSQRVLYTAASPSSSSAP